MLSSGASGIVAPHPTAKNSVLYQRMLEPADGCMIQIVEGYHGDVHLGAFSRHADLELKFSEASHEASISRGRCGRVGHQCTA